MTTTLNADQTEAPPVSVADQRDPDGVHRDHLGQLRLKKDKVVYLCELLGTTVLGSATDLAVPEAGQLLEWYGTLTGDTIGDNALRDARAEWLELHGKPHPGARPRDIQTPRLTAICEFAHGTPLPDWFTPEPVTSPGVDLLKGAPSAPVPMTSHLAGSGAQTPVTSHPPSVTAPTVRVPSAPALDQEPPHAAPEQTAATLLRVRANRGGMIPWTRVATAVALLAAATAYFPSPNAPTLGHSHALGLALSAMYGALAVAAAVWSRPAVYAVAMLSSLGVIGVTLARTEIPAPVIETMVHATLAPPRLAVLASAAAMISSLAALTQAANKPSPETSAVGPLRRLMLGEANDYYVAAVMAGFVSLNTSWRFFGERFHISNSVEKAVMFSVLEVCMLACGRGIAKSVRNSDNGDPGPALAVLWGLQGVAAYFAISLSGLAEGIARVAAGPGLGLVMLHLALGIELRRTHGRVGTWTKVWSELRERALSWLGLDNSSRDAVQRRRDRWLSVAVEIVANAKGEVLDAKESAKMRKAARISGIDSDPARIEVFLAKLAAVQNLADLPKKKFPSPFRNS
ncbi:hypothetical protein ACWDUL_20280 [Nocardia niigatensis]